MAVLGGLLAAAPVAGALEILPSETERTITADAFATNGLLFSIDSKGDGEPGLLPFDASILASAPLGDVTADADADQQSRIDLTELSAAGLVDANVSIGSTASDATTSAEADSIYRVVFSVDESTTVVVSGYVEASTLPSMGDTFAIVELIDFDTFAILFSFAETDGGRTDFSELVPLVPGVNYELYASSLATSAALSPDTNELTFASYSVDLVPEPGTLSALIGGCAALGLLSRRRRASPQ